MSTTTSGAPVTRPRHAAGRRLRGRALVVVVLVLGFGAVGPAAAYWTSGGFGAGSGGTSTTAQAVTLTPATPSSQLYPGGDADVRLTIANPGPAAVEVSSLALASDQGSDGFGVDGAHSGCGLASLAFTTQDNGGAGWTIPAGDSVDVTLDDALAMSLDAANACQGATFTVHLEAGP